MIVVHTKAEGLRASLIRSAEFWSDNVYLLLCFSKSAWISVVLYQWLPLRLPACLLSSSMPYPSVCDSIVTVSILLCSTLT